MKTNKISAMLLSAALACTPILTSTAQIAAFADETTAASTTTTEAEAAVAVPVAVNPDAAVVAAAEPEDTETTTTEAPAAEPTEEPTEPPTEAPTDAPTEAPTTQPATQAATQSATQKATASPTEAYKSGSAIIATEAVNDDTKREAVEGAMSREDQDMGLEITPSGSNGGIRQDTDPYGYNTLVYADLITNPSAFKAAVAANPNFNPFDDIYRFRVPNPNEGKMLYTPNPRWFINTPAAPCNTDDGESATITWTPVPGADGYRYTIRTYVMQPDMDSADYAFTHQHYAGGDPAGSMVGVTTVAGAAESELKDGNDTLEVVTQTPHAADNAYKNHKFETKFRVKEDITVNGRFQEQDATTTYTKKENWKEFTNLDKDVVVGYTYDLEHPHVTVSSTQKVRIEVCIQAFKIDNATGELYNLSDVSEPRVVDLNWVAGESWEGWQGMPDQYEDEYFRAAYHTLNLPEAPNGYEAYWSSARVPVKNDSGYQLAYGGQEYHDPSDKDASVTTIEEYGDYGFVTVTKNHLKDKDGNEYSDTRIKYVDLTNNQSGSGHTGTDAGRSIVDVADMLGIKQELREVEDPGTKQIQLKWFWVEKFDLKGFNKADRPAHYEIDSTVTKEQQDFMKKVNTAIDDDFNRKSKAYDEWYRVNYQPIEQWNKDHAEQTKNAWRIAYKECVTAYAQSQFVENKGYDLRYGLLDLDGNGIPELIISFLKNENKNSYVVIDWQQDRAKLRTVHDKYGTEWYYEDVLAGCAHRGRCYKLDYLGPIDQWKPEDDKVDPLATTTSGSSSASSSASSSSSASGSSSNAAATASTAGAPQTGDKGVAGLVGAAMAAVAGMFGAAKLRRKNK